MGYKLMRMSYSSIIRESEDCAQGRRLGLHRARVLVSSTRIGLEAEDGQFAPVARFYPDFAAGVRPGAYPVRGARRAERRDRRANASRQRPRPQSSCICKEDCRTTKVLIQSRWRPPPTAAS
jgi:hypothetical protein